MKKHAKLLIVTIVFAIAFLWGTGSDSFAISPSEAEASPEITVNTVKTDYLPENETVRWYKFRITEPGYFTINLGPNSSADSEKLGWGWKATIYKKGDLTSNIGELDQVTEFQKSQIYSFRPDTFYIRVENYNKSMNYFTTKEKYDLKVEFNKSNTWEQEINDKAPNANVININTKYEGNFYNSEDVDWFKFIVKEPGDMSITLGPDLNLANTEKLGWGWKAEVYNGSLTKNIGSLDKVTMPKNSGKFALKKGTYYVKIVADGGAYFSPKEQPYNFTINFQGYSQKIAKTKVKILKPKAGKKKVTVKWKKISYATGYEIYRSTKAKKGFKKIGTVTAKKKSYVSKKLKSKKTYYYKVRAFVRIGSKKYYSKYSAVKKVKAK